MNLNSVLNSGVNEFVWWLSVGGFILSTGLEQLADLLVPFTAMISCGLIGTKFYK